MWQISDFLIHFSDEQNFLIQFIERIINKLYESDIFKTYRKCKYEKSLYQLLDKIL